MRIQQRIAGPKSSAIPSATSDGRSDSPAIHGSRWRVKTLSAIRFRRCDGCYLFCGGEYSKCVSSLDEAECEGDLVASVCGDEQRPDGEDRGAADITDGTQYSSATRRSETAAVPIALLLLAPSMMGVAVALEALR